jgi:hypothetical protein
MRDLFAGEPAMPQQAAILAAERHARDALERQQRATNRAARDHVFKLRQIADALGAKLARPLDDREIGQLFHEVCDKLHEAETELYPVSPELGGLRMEAPAAMPPDVAAALSDIGRNFNEGKGPLDAGLERIA